MVDWRATHADYAQQLVLMPLVQEYLWHRRQHRWWRAEAGGQLFGSVDEAQIVIAAATGPYRGDERGRHFYRSNPAKAQAAIDRQRERGRRYLGEWHTHPEDNPQPSHDDVSSFRRLLQRSQLSVSSLVLLVQGRAEASFGVTVMTLDERVVRRWVWHDEGATSLTCARR
jgi:integrative and conjugative element protein (TIGR02256 family)